jgi:hypothetical protein
MSNRTRYILAAALAAGCVVSYFVNAGTPQPTPAPQPEGGLVLRGSFIGPTASADAMTLSCLCDELAAIVEYDGQQPEPRLKTGAALDDLRMCAREIRLRGNSIGARQPRVRDAVAAHMTAKLGEDGGPIDAQRRAEWVATFREIARAADDAAR